MNCQNLKEHIIQKYKDNLYRNIIKYAKNDTEVLPILYQKINETSFKIVETSIMNFPTIGNLANSQFL